MNLMTILMVLCLCIVAWGSNHVKLVGVAR